MIAIIDYGCGNLFSLSSSLKSLGIDCKITGDADEISSAEKIILPGVGAFGDSAEKLRESGMDELLRSQAENGKYILGICLGMQLLFDKSFEYGEHKGLSLIRGVVAPLDGDISEKLKIPHMGWNAIENLRSPLFRGIQEGAFVYYVHSYYPEYSDSETVASTCFAGVTFSAAMNRGNFYGAQFHPEKSGPVGEKILENFLRIC